MAMPATPSARQYTVAEVYAWPDVVKRTAYQENRVGTYWVVDADRRVVEVWHPEDEAPELVTDVLRWRVAPDTPELAVARREVWEKVPR